MEKELKAAAINFAVELCRVKSMPDMPSYFYEAVEKSFIKWARPITDADRAALHKEILASLPKEKEMDKDGLMERFQDGVDMWGEEFADKFNERIHGFNRALSAVRKAIDEVFSSKE